MRSPSSTWPFAAYIQQAAHGLQRPNLHSPSQGLESAIHMAFRGRTSRSRSFESASKAELLHAAHNAMHIERNRKREANACVPISCGWNNTSGQRKRSFPIVMTCKETNTRQKIVRTAVRVYSVSHTGIIVICPHNVYCGY